MKLGSIRTTILSFTAVASLVAPLQGSAITIDAETYFAYTEVRSSNSRMSPPYLVLLSKQKCEAKGGGQGSRKALYKSLTGERPGCWDDFGRQLVAICPATSEKGELGNLCIDISHSKFIDTSSLPKTAKFQ